MYHINKEIIGNGESITLENTAKHYFKDFKIYGNSKQEGTPSIDSEASIESVGDNINLIGMQDGSWTENGLTINVKDNEININGTVTASSNVFFTLKESLNLNGKYSFQAGNNIALTGGEYFRLYTGTTGFEVLVAFGALTSLNVKTENINISGRADRLAIRVNAGTVFNNVTFKPKLEKGTKATPYSPYGQGSIEIYNCNKNLFDKNDTTKILSAIPDGNTLKINSNSNGRIFYIKCKPSTNYTISKLASKRLQFWDSIEKPAIGVTVNSILNTDYVFSGTEKTVKTSSSAKYLVCYYYNSSTDTLSEETIRNSIQLEEGETATEYVEGKSQTKALYTQQPFRAIGDVKDRFVKQNGVWYEEHNIERLILSGTENWGKSSNTNNNIFYIQAIFNTLINKGISNYFTYQIVWNVDKVGVEIYNNRNLRFGLGLNSDITTLEQWKAKVVELYNAGTPVYVDYVLATPTLIECTPEQVEVLEYLKKEAYSYDEVTHIYSTDEVSPYFEVTAYQRISEEFKTRLKEGKITRGYLKVLATDTLPEIIINENNYLKDLKIEELRYVPEEGFIGGTVAKRVSGNFNNVDSSFNIQDREVEVYLGVELEDETTEYIKYGTYIVQRPEDDQVNDNTSFEALDYMIKFNLEYKDRVTYPCTLKQLLDDIIDQAGVNSKVATFANSDFVVENNQFEQGSTLRDVLKAITQVAFNWSRIDADDNLVMDFEIREETDEELGTDDYFSFKKSDEYGPVNVIVLRNSQIEGENVTIKDEALINSPKGYNKLKVIAISQTISGITFTVSEEKTILVNGTATANVGLTLENDWTQYTKGTYRLTGCPSGGTGSTYRIVSWKEGYTVNAVDIGYGTNVIFDGTTKYKTQIFIESGVTVNNLVFKPMLSEGTEEKPYQPYIPIGEIEYVISDNPFAYTELKRKQLIEAGRRLFGLRYTPMTVDMLGLIYLNAKDRISVENLNGEKFNTYLLDHTIDYTGIVLDSMQSQAKTKTETKYQYISSLAQGLSHVEIKVDKANKKIESIVQTQEDVSEKVAKTVARIEVVYTLSDSSTVAPTDGWSTTAPEWTAGKYMWQKTITTYANGTTAETAATNISGAKGEAGQNGIGITQTNITYQKSTSGTTVPTGTWQTTIPEVDENGYLWTRTEFIYSDGSKKYAYNVGKKGAAGIGVKSLVDQYYLSTSNTEQTGGEWQETQPQWEEGNYIWTRTKITWTNDSITYTDPILANTLNDINSEIVVLKEFNSEQVITNQGITTSVSEVTKRLNNEYLTAEQTNSKIDGLEEKYEILDEKVTTTKTTADGFQVQIDAIKNNGVDKITTSMGYTFNDSGLNINRDNADTGTIVDEAGIEVLDKTGSEPTPLLYAGYVKEDDENYPEYAGQTIVATSNLIVKTYLIIGSNSRFQDYNNPTLGGQGTGAFDI